VELACLLDGPRVLWRPARGRRWGWSLLAQPQAGLIPWCRSGRCNGCGLPSAPARVAAPGGGCRRGVQFREPSLAAASPAGYARPGRGLAADFLTWAAERCELGGPAARIRQQGVVGQLTAQNLSPCRQTLALGGRVASLLGRLNAASTKSHCWPLGASGAGAARALGGW